MAGAGLGSLSDSMTSGPPTRGIRLWDNRAAVLCKVTKMENHAASGEDAGPEGAPRAGSPLWGRNRRGAPCLTAQSSDPPSG